MQQKNLCRNWLAVMVLASLAVSVPSLAEQPALDAVTQSALDAYRETLKQTQSLESYNQQLAAMLEFQVAEKETFVGQQKDLEAAEAYVIPQMSKMVDVLEQFVAADIPFLPQERAERLQMLKALIVRADVSVAEKYRRILEAYQIESDYGRTLESWRGELSLKGQTRTVEFLRLGRTMLYYQTADAHDSGWWNEQANQWESLSSNARRPLTAALAMANQQKAPEWLMLPVKTLALEGAK